MKIYIIDENTEAEVYIYGIDGEEHTEQFFYKYFSRKGIQILSDEEKEVYNTSADYALSQISCTALDSVLETIQKTIDIISEDVKISKCDIDKTYSVDGKCYVI